MMVKRQVDHDNQPLQYFTRTDLQKSDFYFQEGLDSSISKASKPSTSPSAEMHVHGMCLRAAGFEKSSSEQENSLLSMRFCKEIEGNSLKFQEKSKTAEGWLNCKENLSTFDKRQWQRCHNYRDSHLN